MSFVELFPHNLLYITLCSVKRLLWDQGGGKLGERGYVQWEQFYGMGLVQGDSLVLECLQEGLRVENFQKEQVCLLERQNLAFEPIRIFYFRSCDLRANLNCQIRREHWRKR